MTARVRELLFTKPFTLDLSAGQLGVELAAGEADALEALLNALVELVLENIYNAGGFCDYEWHIAGAEFGQLLGPDDVCRQCRKSRAEHTLHPVLLCADELELAQKLDKDAKR